MRNTRLCLVLAAVACLSLPTIGHAVEPAAAPVVQALPAGVTASAGALQTAAPVQGPVVYVVQPQATAAPQQAEPESSGGIMGFVTKIGGWGAIIALVLGAVFGIWTGTRSAAAKAAVINSAEASWYAAEAIGGSGAEKFQRAVENFLERMGQTNARVTLKGFQQATQVFADRSAQDRVERERIDAAAKAKAAAEVAQKTGAGALLDEAARG